jgi:hypothetical protein
MQPLINLSESQFKTLKEEGIDLNGYYVLQALESGVKYEQLLDGWIIEEWAAHLYKLSYFSPDSGLTEKGRAFLSRMNDKEFEPTLAEKFRDIFPSKKLPTGKYFRSHVVDIDKKLSYFKKHYPDFTEEEILQAARDYVAYAESRNYMYVRTAMYFIYKEKEGSDLASWCEMNRNKSSIAEMQKEDSKPVDITNLF